MVLLYHTCYRSSQGTNEFGKDITAGRLSKDHSTPSRNGINPSSSMLQTTKNHRPSYLLLPISFRQSFTPRCGHSLFSWVHRFIMDIPSHRQSLVLRVLLY